MSILIRRVSQGLLYRPRENQIHPLGGIIILLIQFILLISPNPIILGLLFVLIFLENVIFGNLTAAINILRAIFPILIIIGLLTFIFGNLLLSFNIILRLGSGAISFSLYFSFTNPSDLSPGKICLSRLHKKKSAGASSADSDEDLKQLHQPPGQHAPR